MKSVIIDLSPIRHGVCNTYDNAMFNWKMLDEKKRRRYKMIAKASLFVIAIIAIQGTVSYATQIDPNLTEEAKRYFTERCKAIGYTNDQINGFLNQYTADQIVWINDDYGAKATRELTHEYMMDTIKQMGENAFKSVAGDFMDTFGANKAGLFLNKLFNLPQIPPTPSMPMPMPKLPSFPLGF